MKCPKCRKGTMRQLVSVVVEAPAECRSLSKVGLRRASVEIKGVLWDQATIFCSKGCGNVLFLGKSKRRKK